LYEEVEPARVLDERAAATGSGKEYLVQYKVSRWGDVAQQQMGADRAYLLLSVCCRAALALGPGQVCVVFD
jgi:hypothetical protein